MSKQKSIFKISLLFAITVFCVVLLLISASFADDQTLADSNSEAQPSEQTQTTPTDPSAPVAPEVLVPEGLTEAEDVADLQEAATEEDSEKAAPVANEANADCPYSVYKSDGTTPATPNVDYNYHEEPEYGESYILSILSDGLVVSNINPNTPATDVIEVNDKASVQSLTLKNVNINATTSRSHAVWIIDYATNHDFTLNIEGNCTISKSNGRSSVQYDARGSGNSNFNLTSSTGATLNINTDNSSYGISAGTDESGTSIFNFNICGNLNLITNSQGSIYVNNGGDDSSRANLNIKDNANVKIVETGEDEAVYCAGNFVLQDNAYLKVDSVEVAVNCENELGLSVWQPAFSVLGNASADLSTTSNSGSDSVYLNLTNFVVNTTGYVNISSAQTFGLSFSDEGEELNVVSGTLYITGNYNDGDDDIGAFYAIKPFTLNYDPEIYQVLGSAEQNVNIDDLVSDAFLGDSVWGDDAYGFYVDVETNAPKVAKTIAFIPPYVPPVPPGPEPGPEPTPTPGGGEDYNSAQTGDNMGDFVALCVFVIAASCGYVLYRKLRKN